MKLDLTSYEKALASFKKAIDRAQKAPADEELRDCVIQRFEYSYELAWKMLKRQLEIEVANPAEIDQLAFKNLLREAAERGFLNNLDAWFSYREARNITSHAYDQKKAQKVYMTALTFYNDAVALLNSLKGRHA